MKSAVNITRRQFLKLIGTASAICLAGFHCVGKAYGQAQSFYSRRVASVYRRDAAMMLRKPQDNPLVKKIYKDFLEHPLSEKSEHLLHTHYVSRKASIDRLKSKGVKLTA